MMAEQVRILDTNSDNILKYGIADHPISNKGFMNIMNSQF
jgi:hypothetical protein